MTSISKITKPLLWIWLIVPLIFALTGNVSAQGTCVSPPAGMVSWWPGDNDAQDIAGNHHDAVLQPGAQASIPGLVGGAFQFDGVAGVADTPLLLPQQGTLDLWVNPSFLSGIHGIIGTFGTSNGDDRLWVTARGPEGGLGVGPNQLVVNLGSRSINEIVVPSPLVVGTWTHLALTFDYSNHQYVLYVNGDAAATSTAIRNAPTQAISFGAVDSDFAQNFFFPGIMDEVTLYNRVLDASEIQDIYDAGSAGKCKVTTVDIDVRPWNKRNPINYRGHGVLPVAILSAEGFDASSQVDQNSLTFGATGNEKSLAFCNHKPKDFNRDGVKDDLVCHFYIEVAGFNCGDAKGFLKGNALNGNAFEGEDLVRIIHCK